MQAAPVGESGEIIKWVGAISDIEEERQLTDRLVFLERVNEIVGQSTEQMEEVRFLNLAQACVPFLADSCFIDLIEGENELRRAAIASTNADAAERSSALAGRSRLRSPIFAEVLVSGTPRFFPTATPETLRLIARDEEHFEFLRSLKIRSVAVVPLLMRGRPLGVVTFLTDESNRRYSSEDFDFIVEIVRRLSIAIDNYYLYKNAKDALSLRDEFLSIASHELKTPVTSIMAFLQALEKRMANPERFDFQKNREYMSLSIKQVERLGSLINYLLDINRINKGTIDYDFTITQLGPVIAEVVERMSVSFPSHHHALWLEDLTSKVRVDLLRFEQALTNLITNAVKYSPRGSTVDIIMKRESDKVFISIKDRGIGISKEHQGFIFSPYYRTPGAISTRVSGLGIGLFVSSQLITMHGGKLSVESEDIHNHAASC